MLVLSLPGDGTLGKLRLSYIGGNFVNSQKGKRDRVYWYLHVVVNDNEKGKSLLQEMLVINTVENQVFEMRHESRRN